MMGWNVPWYTVCTTPLIIVFSQNLILSNVANTHFRKIYDRKLRFRIKTLQQMMSELKVLSVLSVYLNYKK